MKDLIEPKKSWKIPQTHFINAINDEWYRKLVEIENLISKYTNLFYIRKKYKNNAFAYYNGFNIKSYGVRK